MPRYYCDYCDTYLTHDSPSVRKQHNLGYKHKANVRTYYQQFEEQQTQILIDQKIKEHLGNQAAYQQVGAAYNQHLMGQRPHLLMLPTPGKPISGNTAFTVNTPLIPGRPPILPRPFTGAPGYMSAPTMPLMMGPPGAPPAPSLASIPRLQTVPGSTAPPTSSNGAPSMPGMYQANPAPTTGGSEGFNLNTPAFEDNY